MKWPWVSRKRYEDVVGCLDQMARQYDKLKSDIFALKATADSSTAIKAKRDQMTERFVVEYLRSTLIKKEDVHFVKIAKYSRMLADAVVEEMKQEPRSLDAQKFNPSTPKNDE